VLISPATTGVLFLREAVMLPGIEYNTDLNSDDVITSLGVVTVGKISTSSVLADTLKIAQEQKGFISNFAYEVSKHRCYERELLGLTTKVAY
jgi:catalase